MFHTGLSLWGTDVALPGAVFCYAITFLMADVIGEIWGKEEANRTVRFGLVGRITATALITATQYIPAASEKIQTAYEKLLERF